MKTMFAGLMAALIVSTMAVSAQGGILTLSYKEIAGSIIKPHQPMDDILKKDASDGNVDNGYEFTGTVIDTLAILSVHVSHPALAGTLDSPVSLSDYADYRLTFTNNSDVALNFALGIGFTDKTIGNDGAKPDDKWTTIGVGETETISYSLYNDYLVDSEKTIFQQTFCKVDFSG